MCLAVALLALALPPIAAQLAAADDNFRPSAAPLVTQYCLDCHAGNDAEAGLRLDQLLEHAVDANYRQWQRVAAALAQGKMPPPTAPQPPDEQRQQLATAVRSALTQLMEAAADDPGTLVMRRLTSAEYAYSIQDLTGLDLNLGDDFVDGAVGGEGFTNVGTAQFLHDATLERYLAAAKQVASHTVIGAGPLEFFRDPGQTGLELSAIHRLNEIYRRHGFRTAAGEGGEPFGLDQYPRALFAAWQYRHRDRLGLGDASLTKLAQRLGLSPPFAQHIWSVLTAPAPTFPTAEIVAQWQALPEPTGEPAQLDQVRRACDEVYRRLAEWQARLARAVGNEEEAAVLSESTLQVKREHSFTARFAWQETPATVRVEFEVASAAGRQVDPVVIWANPRVRFRRFQRRREELQPLAQALADQARQLPFGQHPRGGKVAASDLVTAGSQTFTFELPVPENARGLDVQADVTLDLAHGENCVVRCSITEHNSGEKPKSVSALVADPESAAFLAWKAGALDFARLLPQVSHREPAPSDRDPIPAPFDNTYNARERDFFHTKVKYFRDDAFFTEKMIDAAKRRELDAAWTDLLASFEYHEICLRFTADKLQLNLAGRGMAQLEPEWIAALPDEPRRHVAALRSSYDSIQQALVAAQPGHLDDVSALAGRAWRRSLSADEAQRLRTFYHQLRTGDGLDHAAAIRALIVRVLVAPEFLYRAERFVSTGSADRRDARPTAVKTPLTGQELASRLSFFLWSSLPDDELAAAANEGKLTDPAELSRQARRMLADPKSRRLATEFFGQWLGFYQFDQYRGVDQDRFPEFGDALKAALYNEAVTFFTHIVQADRPVNEILLADYAFLSEELRQHYGLEHKGLGSHLTQVAGSSERHPGGLLGLGAVLAVTSAPLRTSPVKRGDWLLRRVLGTPVPPPPANAGSIPADDALADGLTVRARLEAHRRDATCANCHARIDPLGFALENYDVLGRWRATYRDGGKIETVGILSDGTQIADFAGLRDYLRQHQAEFHRTLATKLVGYCLGRGEQLADQRLIDDMLAAIAAGHDRFSDLVVKLVASPQFRYHRLAHTTSAGQPDGAEEPTNGQR